MKSNFILKRFVVQDIYPAWINVVAKFSVESFRQSPVREVDQGDWRGGPELELAKGLCGAGTVRAGVYPTPLNVFTRF